MSSTEHQHQTRPIVYNYGSGPEFFQNLLAHYKATSRFSVRQRVQTLEKCSAALVCQVLKGNRRLTRDQLPAFAKLFKLNGFEFEFLDKGLRADFPSAAKNIEQKVFKQRQPKNHILHSWLNVYVKDLVHLKGFSLDSKVLHKMLLGIANPARIEKSVAFLLREGFWRRTSEIKVIPEDAALVSSNEIPSEKIKNFHKQALKIALRGLEVFPADRRKASTILVSVDREKIPELRSLVDSFQNQLLKFIEDNPQGSDDLIQIAVHLTPVGAKND